MDQRVAFIADWLRDEWTMTELAERYQISRKTAYKWVRPLRGGSRAGAGRAIAGAAGARPGDGRRRPRGDAGAAPARIRAGGRRNCGRSLTSGAPRRRLAGGEHDGRSVAARRAESAAATHALCRAVDAAVGGGAGAERCLDRGFQGLVSHGGWDALRSADGGRCVQSIRVVLSHRRAERAAACGRGSSGRFASMGCRGRCGPTTGSPFATTGAGPLSHLAVWWLKLGIQLDRIDPGHPEQNGRHERFHLTLQQETTTPPAATPRSSNAGLIGCGANSIRSGRMKRSGQQPPARLYVPSPRPYPARLEDPWYDATHQVRRVSANGQIKWQGELVFVSEAVRGEARRARGNRARRLDRALHAGGTRAHRSPDAPVYARVARPTDRMSAAAAAAVEMPLPWKSQNDFHRSLEISPRTRDSHIPTADPLRW